jgi:hypothetical protein
MNYTFKRTTSPAEFHEESCSLALRFINFIFQERQAEAESLLACCYSS